MTRLIALEILSNICAVGPRGQETLSAFLLVLIDSPLSVSNPTRVTEVLLALTMCAHVRAFVCVCVCVHIRVCVRTYN